MPPKGRGHAPKSERGQRRKALHGSCESWGTSFGISPRAFRSALLEQPSPLSVDNHLHFGEAQGTKVVLEEGLTELAGHVHNSGFHGRLADRFLRHSESP